MPLWGRDVTIVAYFWWNISTSTVIKIQPQHHTLICIYNVIYKHVLTKKWRAVSCLTRAYLLQRITRSAASDRGLVLHNFVRHDLLCLHPASPNPPSASLLASLLFPVNALTPHPLQQGIARLVNTLASLRAGRDYLAANINILDVLIPCLMEDKDIKTDGKLTFFVTLSSLSNNSDLLHCNIL